MKAYKAKEPDKTINNIRDILDEIGIFIKETPCCYSDNFHVARIAICSNELDNLDIGTNGKGLTYQYSLASGYAEFMERIQNYILFKGYKSAVKCNLNKLPQDSLYRKFLEKNNLVLDFQYDPREVEISTENLIKNNSKFLLELFPFLSKKELLDFIKKDLCFDKNVCVPFYSYEENREVFLPIELIHISSGSNGMCSGNTKEEALIQGFCEIFERYAGNQIYYNNITPPDIPIDEFKGRRVYDLIKKMTDNARYKLIIKDCSLDLGLPTIGVLLIDLYTGKYNFNLGSSLNPDLALERCLTELHQNPNGLYWNDIVFDNYSGNSLYDENFIFINSTKLITDGTGYWPASLFAKKSSYDFKGLNYSLDESDSEDINFIKTLIHKLGYNTYIRDVSFLNFNAYYVVVPGMSQYTKKRSHFSILGESYKQLHSIRKLKTLSGNKIEEMCNVINKDYNSLKQVGFNFSELMVYNVNKDILDLDLELLLFMINYRVLKLDEAYNYMSIFLKDKDFYSYKYYFAIKEYVRLKKQGLDEREIVLQLNILYSEEIEEVADDLRYPEKIFDYHEWSSCFECEKCQIFNDCRQFKFLEIFKKLQLEQSKNIIYHDGFMF